MRRGRAVRWVLGTLAAMVLLGGLGAGAAWWRAPRGAARAANEARAARRAEGQALREAIARIAAGDGDGGLAALASADPANGYGAALRFAAHVVRDDMPAASAELAGALGKPRWRTCDDALGLPDAEALDHELTVWRNAEAAYRIAVLGGRTEGGSAGLARLRDLGLALARVEPPDMVHLRVGATFRVKASEELVRLAEAQGEGATTARMRAMLDADRAWRDRCDRELLAFVRERPTSAESQDGANWARRVGEEESLVRRLTSEAPQ